jgi:hypothetical protein
LIIPETSLFTDYTDLKKRKGYSREQAVKAFGSDIFDKIAAKGKLETRRLKRCSSTHADKCVGSWGDPEVFRYGHYIWEEGKPFPTLFITATDLGWKVLHHTVTYKNMTVMWTEEFEIK